MSAGYTRVRAEQANMRAGPLVWEPWVISTDSEICFQNVEHRGYTASSAGARCAMLGGGGIGEQEASAVTGGGGIEEQATAVFGAGGTAEQDASAVAGGGGIEEQPSAVLGGGGISDPERAGRRALADAASLAPDSISL